MLKCNKESLSVNTIVQAPKKIDFFVTHACNFNCSWCWGPDRNNQQSDVEISKWIELAIRLKKAGLQHVVLTGGEPLLQRGIVTLIEFLKNTLELKITLSTNGLFYPLLSNQISPLIDEIGLPLEGPDIETDLAVRPGNPKRFHAVFDTIREIQQHFKHIEITIRTVVTKVNLPHIHLIGKTMIEQGINPAQLRWKLYQCTPIGPRKDNLTTANWLITNREFKNCQNQVYNYNPQFPNIVFQAIKDQVGRYMHIYPNGQTRVISLKRDGSLQEHFLGNINDNFSGILLNASAFTSQSHRQL